jgi:uncharacterized metal-binding protein
MAACSCSGPSNPVPEKKKTVLFYSCSGGANVADISDRVARALMKEGKGGMFCLAGLGANIPNMVQTAKDADLNLVMDGCPVDCARRIFERHGLKNVKHLRITDLGIEKAKGVPVTEEQVQKALAAARALIG